MLLNELTEDFDFDDFIEKGKYNSEFMYQLTQQSQKRISGFKYMSDNKSVVDDAYANKVPIDKLVQTIIADYSKDGEDDEDDSDYDFHDAWGPDGRYGNYGDEERDKHYDWELADEG